jgi:hypothetical protein
MTVRSRIAALLLTLGMTGGVVLEVADPAQAAGVKAITSAASPRPPIDITQVERLAYNATQNKCKTKNGYDPFAVSIASCHVVYYPHCYLKHKLLRLTGKVRVYCDASFDVLYVPSWSVDNCIARLRWGMWEYDGVWWWVRYDRYKKVDWHCGDRYQA